MEHWHLYMDEGGIFEGTIYDIITRRLSMLFLLVLDTEKYKLEEELRNIYSQYYPSDVYPHAMKHAKTNEFYLCMKNIINVLQNYHLKFFYFKHKDDVYYNDINILNDEHLANRYLNMFSSGLEYITFLDVFSWGKDIKYSYFPCSRVTPIELDNIEKKNKYEKAGYKVFLPNEDSEQYLVILMDTTSLRSSLYNMYREYHIFSPKIGRREYSEIESIVAYKSKDVFVHLVDNLVMILRSGNFNKKLKELRK